MGSSTVGWASWKAQGLSRLLLLLGGDPQVQRVPSGAGPGDSGTVSGPFSQEPKDSPRLRPAPSWVGWGGWAPKTLSPVRSGRQPLRKEGREIQGLLPGGSIAILCPGRRPRKGGPAPDLQGHRPSLGTLCCREGRAWVAWRN